MRERHSEESASSLELAASAGGYYNYHTAHFAE